ncbi:MAG: hypothetical protein QHG99_04855 [Methanomicrobiales archaeon]|nr:hypothetical protein [Methanomicrobiales archaeon]
MRLDDLRNVLLSERESGRLVEIPPRLFEGALERLAELEREVKQIGDPLSEQSHILVEEIYSIRETMRDIFQIRMRKILTLALTSLESTEDRDEMKKMHASEQGMYSAIASAMESCRRVLMEPGRIEQGTVMEEEIVDTGEKVAVAPSESGPYDEVLVRILKDMEPFMGVDGRVYHLKKEDIVCLPRIHAEILQESNIALNINTGT